MSARSFRIICPRNTVTGGPEALHQLCAAMVQAGLDARIVYVPIRPDNACPEKFRSYGAPVAQDLPDREDTVIIVGETFTHFVWRFQQARVLIWWLSVDFHFARPTKWTKKVKLWLRERNPTQRPYAFQPRDNVRHAWQSEYARRFLVSRGVTDPLPLTDYISPALTVPETALHIEGRRNLCLYNPKKGREFTSRLIEACAGLDLEFVPLQGYTETQLRDLFASAKLYIDFGEHPGRDRIPREAAASGCVVVTGQRGSAGNPVDVPLPEIYKIDEQQPTALASIRRLLEDVTARFPDHFAAQADYRQTVRQQRDIFLREAASLASL